MTCSIVTAVMFVCGTTRAYADAPPSAWETGAPQGGAPVAPLGGYPYGAAPGDPYAINPQAMFAYDNQKKNPAVALVIEIFVPGVGSIYADHAVGALITWGLMIGGVVVLVAGIESQIHTNPDGTTTTGDIDLPLLVGLGMILGGRIYGLVDSWSSSNDYNRALAQRMGLPAGVALHLAPIRMDQNVAWGPSLSLRF